MMANTNDCAPPFPIGSFLQRLFSCCAGSFGTANICCSRLCLHIVNRLFLTLHRIKQSTVQRCHCTSYLAYRLKITHVDDASIDSRMQSFSREAGAAGTLLSYAIDIRNTLPYTCTHLPAHRYTTCCWAYTDVSRMWLICPPPASTHASTQAITMYSWSSRCDCVSGGKRD